MNFVNPIYLYILPVAVAGLALFLWWSEGQRRAAMARLGNPALIAQLAAGVNRSGRFWRQVLWCGAVALLLLAMARPQWGEEERTVERAGLQIVVALDVSTSMLADDLKPNRLERARLEIVDLMSRLQGDEIALVPFSGASFVQFPLTTDYATARRFLDGVSTETISRPGTNVSDALQTALRAFDENATSQRVIIVITDGEAHDETVLAMAQDVASQGVMIYTLGFGSPEGAMVPELDAWGNLMGFKMDETGAPLISKLDEATLQEIARIGGGSYYLATAGGGELDALAADLATLQQGSFGEHTDVQRIERFQLFLAGALALLALSQLIPERAPQRRVRPTPAPSAKTAPAAAKIAQAGRG